MKKILYLYFIFGVSLFATNLNNYELKLVRSIDNGILPGQLGRDYNPRGSGGYNRASNFVVGENNLIYIVDIINKRINIYDTKLNFLSNIKTNNSLEGIEYAYYMKIQKNGVITLMSDDYLYQIDSKGKLIFKINKSNIPHIYGGFYPIGNFVYYYDKNGKIQSIDSKGTSYSYIETFKMLYNSVDGNIDSSKSDVKNIVLNNTLLTVSWEKVQEYYRDSSVEQNDSFGFSNKEPVFNLFAGKEMIGVDENGNTFWRVYDFDSKTDVILIYSNLGLILDVFTFTNADSDYSYIYSVAPNGDIYLMNTMFEVVKFYVVDRTQNKGIE